GSGTAGREEMMRRYKHVVAGFSPRSAASAGECGLKPATTYARPQLLFMSILLLFAGFAFGQRPSQQSSKIGVLHIQGNVYLLYGAGANITMQVGDQAVVLVDSGPAQLSDEVRAAIRTVSNKPIGFIINTSADRDRTGGNENLAKGGFLMLESANESNPQASVVAHLNVLTRMTQENITPRGLWPTDTYDSSDWKLYANGEALIIEHVPAAHSDGDSIVF